MDELSDRGSIVPVVWQGLKAGLGHRPQTSSVVAALLVGGLVFHMAHGLGLFGHALDSLVNDWVYDGLMVGAAGLCLARGRGPGRHRVAWLSLGAGIAFWAVGEILYSVLYGDGEAPIPSISDPFWLAFYPCAFVAIAVLARDQAPGDIDLWLDGAVVAGAAAALISVTLVDPVIEGTGGSLSTVATNVAYPAADVLLLGMVVWSFGVSRWRPARVLLIVGAGLVVVSLADSLYLYRTAIGTYDVGTLLDSLWPAGMLTLAAAAWAPGVPLRVPVRRGRRVLAIPAAAAAVSVGVLVYGNFESIGWLSLVFAAGTAVLVIIRAGRAFPRMATIAMLEERRRIARDLHDGLAQELAFIGRNAAQLDDDGGQGDLPQRIRAAVERARIETRLAIATLTEDAEGPFDERLARAARDVADRHGVTLDLDLDPAVVVAAEDRVQVVRIACEAITNAARHSGTDHVRVVLQRGPQGAQLTVIDMGCGFDPDAADVRGFGLVGMRERAQALGTTLEIVSSHETGTRVLVRL